VCLFVVAFLGGVLCLFVVNRVRPGGGFPQVLRMPEVVAVSGLSRTTLWRFRQTDEFPNAGPFGR